MLVAQANLWRITGDHPAAEQALAQALAISRDLHAEGVETEVLNTTGSLCYASGDLDNAVDHHHKALHRARQLALPLEEGRARQAWPAARSASATAPPHSPACSRPTPY